jgi:hypothetical protein
MFEERFESSVIKRNEEAEIAVSFDGNENGLARATFHSAQWQRAQRAASAVRGHHCARFGIPRTSIATANFLKARQTRTRRGSTVVTAPRKWEVMQFSQRHAFVSGRVTSDRMPN